MTAAFIQDALDKMFEQPKPTEVWICGHKFKIDFFENNKIEGGDLGQCDFNRSRIQVWSGLAPDMRRNVLLHELNHAIYEFTGLDDRRDEENIVNLMSTFQIGVLRDPRNKILVEYLTH